jgi:hypothetical protein
MTETDGIPDQVFALACVRGIPINTVATLAAILTGRKPQD